MGHCVGHVPRRGQWPHKDIPLTNTAVGLRGLGLGVELNQRWIPAHRHLPLPREDVGVSLLGLRRAGFVSVSEHPHGTVTRHHVTTAQGGLCPTRSHPTIPRFHVTRTARRHLLLLLLRRRLKSMSEGLLPAALALWRKSGRYRRAVCACLHVALGDLGLRPVPEQRGGRVRDVALLAAVLRQRGGRQHEAELGLRPGSGPKGRGCVQSHVAHRDAGGAGLELAHVRLHGFLGPVRDTPR